MNMRFKVTTTRLSVNNRRKIITITADRLHTEAGVLVFANDSNVTVPSVVRAFNRDEWARVRQIDDAA